jgi:hypothetical protein
VKEFEMDDLKAEAELHFDGVWILNCFMRKLKVLDLYMLSEKI